PPAKAPASKAPAAKSAAPASSLLSPSSLTARAPENYKAAFSTTKGDFVIEVQRDSAPIGTDRSYNLGRAGVNNDVPFFRVIENFMAQFGISGTPKVAEAWSNANIKDDPVKQSNKRGYITFATAGPNTRTTQVFINFKDNTFLDTQGFAPFGEVVEGMDVVDKLYNGYGDAPRGPDQGRLASEGKAYFEKSFPKLDTVKTAKIVPPAGAAAPAPAKAAPAAPPKK